MRRNMWLELFAEIIVPSFSIVPVKRSDADIILVPL
jgi:hypothetical protein